LRGFSNTPFTAGGAPINLSGPYHQANLNLTSLFEGCGKFHGNLSGAGGIGEAQID
jgi:hypothetical protein